MRPSGQSVEERDLAGGVSFYEHFEEGGVEQERHKSHRPESDVGQQQVVVRERHIVQELYTSETLLVV